MQTVTKQFQLKDQRVVLYAIILKEQILMVISNQTLQAFDNLFLALQTQYDPLPTVLNLSQQNLREDEELLEMLVRSLSKKLKKSLILSYNLDLKLDQESMTIIQQQSLEMINQQ